MRRPRVGFLGVGWIGRHRMRAIAAADIVDLVAVADASADAAEAGAALVGAAAVEADAVLDGRLGLDGVVIATPSALHAEQAITALSSGAAVFCQKPLGRTAAECEAVVQAAERVDRLLGVDLSYRHVRAVEVARRELRDGAIGDVCAVELVFHNAYGPDKAWFRDPALAGGGCVIDLGIHLVDLLLWLLPGTKVDAIAARLYSGGRPLPRGGSAVEDLALALLQLSDGATATLACSWHLHAGKDADISMTLHGTTGSIRITNVGGSFYDFRALLRRGTSEQVLVEPPNDWGGRAAVEWARRLAAGSTFDPAVAEIVEVARVLDGIYGR